MKVDGKQLEEAVRAGILDADQAARLLEFARSHPGAGPRFDLTHVLYYLGGLIAIGAMTLFMTLGWQRFGGWGVFFISLAYAGAGLWLASRFGERGYPVPAGICATFTVALTPLAIYGLQRGLGVWPDDDSVYRAYHIYIRWHWLYMELGTLAVGVVVAWRYRYAFLVMPIAATLWYLSMDLTAMIAGGEYFDWALRSLVSMYFGLLVVALAFWVDVRSRHTVDYAFWLYLFGVMAFWGGLTSQHSDSELSKLLYFCINLALIGIGVVLVRRVFPVFGAIGCTLYLGHLASSVFRDSVLFPIALTATGLAIIYLGVLWQKNERALSAQARQLLPVALRELVDRARL